MSTLGTGALGGIGAGVVRGRPAAGVRRTPDEPERLHGNGRLDTRALG